MIKNFDSKIIVMDYDMYKRLLCLAEIGSFESGDYDTPKIVDKHVRRFNEHRKKDYLNELELEKEANKEYKKLQRELRQNK